MSRRLFAVIVSLFIMSAFCTTKMFYTINSGKIAEAAFNTGGYRISQIGSYASIFDYKGEKLSNFTPKFSAVINPNDDSVIKAFPYIADRNKYNSGITGRLPFLCDIASNELKNENVIVFKSYVRNVSNQLAPHIVGYTSDNRGMCGIEYAFDDFLRSNYTVNEVRFSVDAKGGVLSGLKSDIKLADELKAGIITTLDGRIQSVCESAMESSGYTKGAVIVMDIKNGAIRACASYPDFDPSEVEDYLDRNDAPLVNRAFSAYSVGSVFKLVTAAAALENGISKECTFSCSGSIDVNSQVFNCHKWGGHGEINMTEAVVNSCNPYFISLSEYIDKKRFIAAASSLGFGEKTELCKGMVSASGYLPSVKDISVPAERANFSFGQGKLTATPLQICRMTCTIANNGVIASPKLIVGYADKDGTVYEEENQMNCRVLSFMTAQKLRDFMVKTVESDNSQAKSVMVSCGGKTSTAQTGIINPDGTEKVNCWFTGYFPADLPEYAVTVLIEDGISGNASAAPVFKNIMESIERLNKNSPLYSE